MKAFIISCALLAAICIFVGVHSVAMINMSENIINECNTVIRLAEDDSWNEALTKIDHIKVELEKKRIWSAMTVSAKNIEEIETSLNRSRAFAELHQKPDFLGEFVLFRGLIQRIPAREGLKIEEIL